MLAVEHIQAKSNPIYAHLIGRWNNFLLSCVNCNSTKLAGDFPLAEIYLTDRDNTALVYQYTADGRVDARDDLPDASRQIALRSLGMTGLARPGNRVLDDNGQLVALDRVAQRMEAWLIAEASLNELAEQPAHEALQRTIIRLAKAVGFFSIWMKVFSDYPDMRLRLIHAFPGTAASGCFDLDTGIAVTPCPNFDQLEHGGKT